MSHAKRESAVPDVLRVIDRAQVIEAVGVSPNTWERMEKRGETPPVTKLSKRRDRVSRRRFAELA
jgi:hypothetical protein